MFAIARPHPAAPINPASAYGKKHLQSKHRFQQHTALNIVTLQIITTTKPMRTLNQDILQDKLLLKNYTQQELEQLITELGIPKFRASQVYKAVYGNQVPSFAGITTLSKNLQQQLDEKFIFTSVTLDKKQTSSDGTIKFLFTLADGAQIESVLIPSEMEVAEGTPKRRTLCISTQAGCPLGCEFCATATLKLRRNLETPISNIVFMGMGEPMLNYDNVMKAVDIFTNTQTPVLSSKKITLSTAGVLPGILRMADEKRTIKLALSLHATTNGIRQKLMPIANKYSLEELGNALEYYYRATKIPVTFEYILFDGLNDTELDVKRLAKLTRRFPSKVNVIPFHEIDFTNPSGFSAELKAAPKEKFFLFLKRLKENNVQVMVRSSSGLDIDAACGQLAFSSAAQ